MGSRVSTCGLLSSCVPLRSTKKNCRVGREVWGGAGLLRLRREFGQHCGGRLAGCPAGQVGSGEELHSVQLGRLKAGDSVSCCSIRHGVLWADA